MSEAKDFDALTELTRRVSAMDDQAAIAAVEEAIRGSPGNARLHFLRGSLFAENGDYPKALADFQAATELAPDFPIARFQLGLLELCLGQSERAKEIWRPLDQLEENNCLRLFKEGLCHLADERLQEGVDRLQAGRATNRTFPPLNRDMQLLIDRSLERLQKGESRSADQDLHVLLAGYLGGSTRH